VLGTVMMLVGENSRIISKRVEEELAKLERKLPAGLDDPHSVCPQRGRGPHDRNGGAQSL
jgi:hypothetical protein